MDDFPADEHPSAASEPSELNGGNEYLLMAAKSLRLHLGLAEIPGEESTQAPSSPKPIIWIEAVPSWVISAKCGLGHECSEAISAGEYRIAVIPGQNGYFEYPTPGTVN